MHEASGKSGNLWTRPRKGSIFFCRISARLERQRARLKPMFRPCFRCLRAWILRGSSGNLVAAFGAASVAQGKPWFTSSVTSKACRGFVPRPPETHPNFDVSTSERAAKAVSTASKTGKRGPRDASECKAPFWMPKLLKRRLHALKWSVLAVFRPFCEALFFTPLSDDATFTAASSALHRNHSPYLRLFSVFFPTRSVFSFLGAILDGEILNMEYHILEYGVQMSENGCTPNWRFWQPNRAHRHFKTRFFNFF